MKWYRVIILLTAVLFLSSCAVFKPSRELEIIPAEKANEVRSLLSALQSKNNTLKSFKGIGKISVWQNGVMQVDQRVAWIGEKPLKLSIAVLISGYPAIKLATDGQWLYYLETRGHDTIFKKIAASDPNLRNIISIPITSSDVVTLLAGGIPLRKFDAVDVIADKSGDGYVFILKERWWGIRQKIYFDESGFQVRQVDTFDRSGELKYRAEIENMRSVDGYQVPFRLKLSSDEGADFLLDIDRYWVNVELPASVFVLAPPE